MSAGPRLWPTTDAFGMHFSLLTSVHLWVCKCQWPACPYFPKCECEPRRCACVRVHTCGGQVLQWIYTSTYADVCEQLSAHADVMLCLCVGVLVRRCADVVDKLRVCMGVWQPSTTRHCHDMALRPWGHMLGLKIVDNM
eukprot:15431682-Alexandrium_andersonii.AAC.1